MLSQLTKLCRLRLGMKPILDYAQSRRRLYGVVDLDIKTVFDIGANIGKKSRLYRKLFPQAKIYCVEPSAKCCQGLRRWASKSAGQVEVFETAMGSRSGQIDFFFQPRRTGGSTVVTPSAQASRQFVRSRVPIETLDGLAATLDVREEILVKIDVEGYDLEVIEGGAETLRRAAAVIVEIDLPDRPSGRPLFVDFATKLHELGYMYRGNLTHGFVNGVACVADAVFVQPQRRKPARCA